MVTVTGTIFKTRLQDGDASATEAEYSLETAIDLLNTYGAGLDSLTGDAGSKTGSYTSAEAGAIWTMAREVYKVHWKNADGASSAVGAVNMSAVNDTYLLRMARQLARQLATKNFQRA